MRDHKLDFVKGFLVFVMVLYHAMNYFSNASPEVYGYLRFVNGAFVFISGYVISFFYRPATDRDCRAMSTRLASRGLKLLLIFTTLNLVISGLGLSSYKSVQFGLDAFLSNLSGIYFRGDSNSMAFRILAPIAYVLLIAPVILRGHSRTSGLAVAVVLVATGYSWLGLQWPNLYFLLVGLAGLVAGRVVTFSDFFHIDNRLISLVAFVALAVVMNELSGNAATYSLGIFLVLKLVYHQATTLNSEGRFARTMVLIGQYSLVAYISQIAFLHMLHLAFPEEFSRSVLALPCAFVLTTALMVLLPILISRSRLRCPVLDGLYRLVFG